MARTTVYGAGAIGGVTGAALARAGRDVLLVDQVVDHVAAMNASGLTVRTRDGDWTAAVRAVTPGEMPGSNDLVLLAVKAQATEAALDVVVPRLSADGVIVSLQNGLNEERIAGRIGAARTIGCLVNWGADWIGPGVIQYGGAGAFVLGELDGSPSRRVEELAALLQVVNATRTSDNVWGLKWSKHVYAALLVATATVDAHVYDVVERSPAIQRMLVDLVAEGMAVAKAAGIRLEAFDEYDPAWYWAGATGDRAAVDRAMAVTAAHYRSTAKTKTGIWRDLAVRKRPTEVGAHFGSTLAKADALGIPMPLTRRLLAQIHELETSRRVMAWSNLDEMAALDAAVRGAAARS